MKKGIIIKTFKILICALLSIIVVFGVIVIPFYYSITALTTPETVAMVIQEVDYKKVIQKNPTIKKTLKKYGITPKDADSIMKSKKTGELVELYADEVREIFLDIPEEVKLDVPYIKELVDNNTDKFLDLAEQNTNLKFKRKEVQKNVDTFFETNEVVIEESVQVIEQVRDVVKIIHTSRVLQRQISLWVAVAFIATVFIILAIIIALMRSNGFLWVGIDFTVISILLFAIIVFSKSSFIADIALKMSDFGTQIIESAISISTQKMIIAVFGTVILAMLFISFYVLLKVLKRKYQSPTYIPLSVEDKNTEN